MPNQINTARVVSGKLEAQPDPALPYLFAAAGYIASFGPAKEIAPLSPYALQSITVLGRQLTELADRARREAKRTPEGGAA